MKCFADVAVSQFCILYEEVMQEQGVDGAPDGTEMFKLMTAKMNEMNVKDQDQVVSTTRMLRAVDPVSGCKGDQVSCRSPLVVEVRAAPHLSFACGRIVVDPA